MNIITNNVPRHIVDAYELTLDERKEFDYLDWNAIDNGTDSASFVRYKGDLIDLGEFTSTTLMTVKPFSDWDGYTSDSFFSGTVIRYASDHESVIMGRYYT